MRIANRLGLPTHRPWMNSMVLLGLSLLGGAATGMLVVVGAQWSLEGLLVLLVMLTAAAGLLILGQLRRPLLALLAFSLPLHLDWYLGIFRQIHSTGPSAALFRITANDVLLAALLFFWLLDCARKRRLIIRLFPATTVPAVLFLCVGLLSITSSREPRLTIYQVGELIKGFMLYLYLANTTQDDADFSWILAGTICSVAFQSGLGVFQAVNQHPLGLELLGEREQVAIHILGDQTTIRPSGTLWHTNHLSMYLGMMLPLVAVRIILPGNWRVRLFSGAVWLLGLLAIGYTLSRGAWIGLLLAMSMFLAYNLRRKLVSRSQLVAGCVLALVFLLAMNLATAGLIVQRFISDDHGSAFSRIPMMRGALQIIADHPLLGSGLGNYQYTILAYDVTGEFTASGIQRVVHNLFLLLAAETGLIGLGVWAWLLLELGKRGLRFLRCGPVGLATTMTMAILSSGLHMLIHNTVDFGIFSDPQLLYVFWFIAGLLVALTDSESTGPSSTVEERPSPRRGSNGLLKALSARHQDARASFMDLRLRTQW